MEGSARVCCGRHVPAPSASLRSSCLPGSARSQRFCPLLRRAASAPGYGRVVTCCQGWYQDQPLPVSFTKSRNLLSSPLAGPPPPLEEAQAHIGEPLQPWGKLLSRRGISGGTTRQEEKRESHKRHALAREAFLYPRTLFAPYPSITLIYTRQHWDDRLGSGLRSISGDRSRPNGRSHPGASCRFAGPCLCRERAGTPSLFAAGAEDESRLRRQDVGLKNHLHQLDQRISELKLDVSKTSSEYLDSDSRPSSGFYDLSDGGSCSLSNSCTSVYSESISSSHTSLLPSSQHPKARLSVFDYRPKSADETTVHITSFQQQGAYGSNGCRTAASRDVSGTPARSRPRPVSTGDLERLIPADMRYQKEMDPKSVLPLCHDGDMHLFSMDPKFQNDLVSKNGIDVYPYPSPLHAVALQSPLFSLVGTSPKSDFQAPPSKPMPSTTGPSLIKTRPTSEVKPGGYINKLLQLTRCKGSSRAETSEWVSPKSQPAAVHQRLIITASTGGVKINSSSSQLEKQTSSLESNKAEGKLSREVPEGECAKQQETMSCMNEEQSSTQPDIEPSAVNSCYPAKSAARGSPLAEETESSMERSLPYSQLCQEDSSPDTWNAKAVPPKKLPVKRCGNAKLAYTGGHERVARAEFVHAQFVPAESHQVRVKFANSKTKAVKIKRRNSEKVIRPGKQAFCMEKVRGSHGATKLPVEWNQLQRPQGMKSLMRRPSYSGDMAGRSCSESSLFPVQVRLPTVPSRPELYRASANALYSLDAACADTASRKKQRKWQSTVEISAKAQPAGLSHSFGLGAPRQPVRRASVLHNVSTRARSKGQQHGDCAKSESDHSEYSAECASLFHSTIAETSEGEVSDFTANRFGDSESSEGDWDGSSNSSSLALDYDEGDESELIWPEGSVRQSVTVQTSSKPLPPVPKICRIKASKALKKKIRRFQPASLKVMTMV
ncbi:dapper homolog 2 [Geospiza fortis]|uniref:Dapper homolog 2 n=1 Tax=Geospiza fortis TaxID=48883 RepID=A0A6I9ZAV4_GEOFO|nr:dapper homolog 2 [Geospiza fortis]